MTIELSSTSTCVADEPTTNSRLRPSRQSVASQTKKKTRQKAPIGLATPLPVISNAEPWMGSNIEGDFPSGLRFEVGAMLSDPVTAARSERISACRLVATMVSRVPGLRVMRAVMASTTVPTSPSPGCSFERLQVDPGPDYWPNGAAYSFVLGWVTELLLRQLEIPGKVKVKRTWSKRESGNSFAGHTTLTEPIPTT
jgi:hypothetical protein